MQSQERDRIAAFLEGAMSDSASAEAVTALVVTLLRDIDQALSPIVGQQGVAAIYKRSLHLARPMHPWLPVATEGADAKTDLAALTATMAAQTAVAAASAGSQLLNSFLALLNSLIGESLTERLLRPVWATILSGAPARDTKS